MRILHLCSARSIGGGEKHVVSLANGLAHRGHEVYVAAALDSPLLPLLNELPSENIIQLPMRNALSLGSTWKIARFAKSHRVQIVHAHLGRDYPLAALAAARSGARLVLTRHVMFPLGSVHRLTLRRTARVIAVSQAVAAALRAQAIFRPESIYVIHNGIDVEPFAQAYEKNSGVKERLRVGTVGEIGPVKRYDDLIRVAQKICTEREDVEFIIAGEDKSREGEHRTQLQKLITDSHLEHRVHLVGWIEDIAPLLASFDVFVSTSETESFGMAIAEAMAAGVAVVATETDGAREIIGPDVAGLLVPIGDVDAIAKAITRLLDDSSERARLGATGKQAARERFGLDRMVDETVKLYEELVCETTSAPAP